MNLKINDTNDDTGLSQSYVEIIEKKKGYEGYFDLDVYLIKHALYNGGCSKERKLELLETSNGISLLPYDPVLDKVLLIEQFRIGAIHEKTGPWLKEIVSGTVNPSEHKEDAVRREALEEIGQEIGELITISEYFVTPGGSTEKMTLFCGQIDATNPRRYTGCYQEDEDIKVSAYGFKDAWNDIQQGKIMTSTTIIAMQWLYLNRYQLREIWNPKFRSQDSNLLLTR